MKNKVELLSPVGNKESLYQAVMNGADAVYLGGKKFGARKFAENFDEKEMVEAIEYCHLYGVKIYVTVNTMIYEKELDEVLEYVEFLHRNQVDALIMQDLGLIKLVRERFPNLEIHASTQCHNHEEEGIKILKELGVTRVVLARELSLEEIKKMPIEIEKEVFIHGALCVSYSGCCLFSSMNGGRSGNRGECVGSCRLPYELYQNGKKVSTEGPYLLSTKSLCTLENIGQLIDSGITSFKIEGRMKSPEYVGYVTRLYKEKIKQYQERGKITIEKEELKNLEKIYNREFTLGYLFKDSQESLMNIKTSNHIGVVLGKVLSVDQKKIKILLSEDLNQEDGIRFDEEKGMIVNRLYDAKGLLVRSVPRGKVAILDNKLGIKNASLVRKTIDSLLVKSMKNLPKRKIGVVIEVSMKKGQPWSLSMRDEENKVEVYGSILEEAVQSPTSLERVKEQLEKLGNTPFVAEKTKIEMDSNLFVPIQEINEVRRKAVEELISKRRKKTVHPFVKVESKSIVPSKRIEEKPSLSVLVRNEEQLKVALEEEVEEIIVVDWPLYLKYKFQGNIYYRTRRVENHQIDYHHEKLLATTLGAIGKYSKDNQVQSDYYLNVANSSTALYLQELGASRVTVSVENSLEDVKNIARVVSSLETVVYGRVELMVSKYCPIRMLVGKNIKNCALCEEGVYSFKDKFGSFYPIVNEKHLTHILDSKNLNKISNIQEYLSVGIRHFRIELFDEKKEEVVKLIREVREKYE